MARGLYRAGILLIALALSASMAEARPRSVITRPDWQEKPSGEDMERFYPERAKTEEGEGRATIVCTVNAGGSLVDCTVVDETPKAYGFGEAALSLSAMFRMKPKTIDGVAVDGGVITIPIIFRVPPPPALGDAAIVLTEIDPALPPLPAEALVISCPNSVNQCQGHFFEWASRPDKARSARIVAGVTPSEQGMGAMCAIASNGELKDCEFSGDLVPNNVAAAQETVKLLRAPRTTEDGVTTAGTVVLIPFQWEWFVGASAKPAKP